MKKGDTMVGRIRKGLFILPILLILTCGILPRQGAAQPQKPELPKTPVVRLGGVTFAVKDVAAIPSPLKFLEVQVEVMNFGGADAAPGSIKVLVTPREFVSAEGAALKGIPSAEEILLPVALGARSGRVVIAGFSLPPERIRSIEFEVQINPPEGEKKTVTWQPKNE
jgi:hypothetical protein